ncbi:MAG: hypothetical protein VX278_21500, partial [Myxococcota bacterium]|nr:hypothetical protein [Myxococcota bacterium]
HTETWTLLEGKDGQYVLRDEAEKLFAELGIRQKKRDIWVAGIVAIGDHLRGMERLIIEDHPSGFTIANPGDGSVEGASFRLSGLTKEPLIMLDHVALPEEQYSWDAEGFSFSMDVQANTLHRIDVVSQEMSMLDRWTWKIRTNAGE